MPDSDEEEVSLDALSKGEDEDDDEDGFFSGEDDLQNVEIEGDDDDGSEGEDMDGESFGSFG